MNNLRNSMAPIFVRNLFTQMAIGKRSNLLSCLFYLQITLVCFQNCFVDTSSRECTFGIQWLNFLCPCVGDHSCQTRKVAASGLHAFVCRAAMSSLLTPPINSPSHRNYHNPTFLEYVCWFIAEQQTETFRSCCHVCWESFAWRPMDSLLVRDCGVRDDGSHLE